MPIEHPRSIIAALLIALGLVGAGWFAAQGMARLKTQDRFVTVKGSAEKIVNADLVVWPLPHTVGGNDLAGVQTQLDANTEVIKRFFATAGFAADEIVVSPPRWRIAGRMSTATTVHRNAIATRPPSPCVPRRCRRHWSRCARVATWWHAA